MNSEKVKNVEARVERIAARVMSASAMDEALDLLKREYADGVKSPEFKKVWESVRNVLERGPVFATLDRMIAGKEAFRAFSEKDFVDNWNADPKHVWYKILPKELVGDKLTIYVSMDEIRGREMIRFDHANKLVQMKIKPDTSLKKIFREAVDLVVKSGPEASALFHRYGYPKFDKL
jgi:hypothetical protein